MILTCDSSTEGKSIAMTGPPISMANTQKGKENNTKGRKAVCAQCSFSCDIDVRNRQGVLLRESRSHWQKGETRLSQPLL